MFPYSSVSSVADFHNLRTVGFTFNCFRVNILSPFLELSTLLHSLTVAPTLVALHMLPHSLTLIISDYHPYGHCPSGHRLQNMLECLYLFSMMLMTSRHQILSITGVKFPGYIYFHSESGAPSGARLQNMLHCFGICLAYCY